jgi:hypothetical protein
VSKSKPSPAPAGLGSAGRALWRSIARQVADDGLELDAREHRWLADACAEADLVGVLASALTDAPLMVRGSQGQDVINPLIPELRQHREALGRLLKRLELADPNALEGSGRGSQTTSTTARAAALSKRGYGIVA